MLDQTKHQKKSDLSDFASDMVVGARVAGLSISGTGISNHSCI